MTGPLTRIAETREKINLHNVAGKAWQRNLISAPQFTRLAAKTDNMSVCWMASKSREWRLDWLAEQERELGIF